VLYLWLTELVGWVTMCVNYFNSNDEVFCRMARFSLFHVKLTTVDRVLNVMLLLVGLSIVMLLARNQFMPKNNASRGKSLVGTRISVEGVDWRRNRHSVLLVLSTGCHYCEESVPFYRVLSEEAQRRQVPVIVVFPEEVNEAEKYLASNRIVVTTIRQTPLYRLGVHGTPSVLWVDQDGMVQKEWYGMLASGEQQKVLNVLGS